MAHELHQEKQFGPSKYMSWSTFWSKQYELVNKVKLEEENFDCNVRTARSVCDDKLEVTISDQGKC